MNFFNPRSLALVAATAVLTTVSMVQTEAAHAFMIRRTATTPAASTINPSLAAPTVIDFSNTTLFPNGSVPNSATNVGPGSRGDGLNGGATINQISGNADYGTRTQPTDGLRLGNPNGGGQGIVNFAFDDPRGMGYFGFFLMESPVNLAGASIGFFSGTREIATMTIQALLNNTVDGSTVFGTGNYFNFFVTNNDEIFNRVVLTKTAGAGNFVVNNLAYQAIPTPALLPGLVALGIGAVRKRKAEAEAEA